MSDQPTPETTSPDAAAAATEAAQHVVDNVTSWEYSADKDRIESELDEGLSEAGVAVDEHQKERLVQDIDALKDEENGGTPTVSQASPQE